MHTGFPSRILPSRKREKLQPLFLIWSQCDSIHTAPINQKIQTRRVLYRELKQMPHMRHSKTIWLPTGVIEPGAVTSEVRPSLQENHRNCTMRQLQSMTPAFPFHQPLSGFAIM